MSKAHSSQCSVGTLSGKWLEWDRDLFRDAEASPYRDDNKEWKVALAEMVHRSKVKNKSV